MNKQNVDYMEFKKIRLEFDKLPLALPQDWDQMRGIRRDFELFQFVLGFKSSSKDCAKDDIKIQDNKFMIKRLLKSGEALEERVEKLETTDAKDGTFVECPKCKINYAICNCSGHTKDGGE